MLEYQYSHLVDEARDIRLLLLRPGKFDDDFKVAIAHVSLPEPISLPNQRTSLDDLGATLPVGWQVFQSVDGRHIFEHAESASTTWTHPDSNVSSYDKVGNIPNETFRPIYEALSYTWGTAENPTRLYVESDDPLGPLWTLEIQQNLASALKHLRHTEATRTLWVDAVCINQGSISERNTQVTRMTSIYRCAYSVVVWLGLESLDSKIAFSALNQIGSQTVLTKCARRVRNPDAYYTDWFSGETDLPYGEDVWRAILALVNRPWFDRVWVVQEIQLANSTAMIQCGNDLISWGRLRTAAWCIFRKLSSPYPPLTRRLAAIKILLVSLEELNFRHLLYGSSSRLCTDQRDHVYGLLGLASPGILSEIQPQYSSDVGNTYISAFLAILRQSQRLDALADCGLESTRTRPSDLPSWVPNWDVPIEEQVGVLNSLYSGTGRSSAEATFLHPNILEVTGVPSGVVDILKGPALQDSGEHLQAVWNWAPKDIRKGMYPTGESVSTAYALSLSLGMVLERFPAAAGIIPSLQDLQKDVEDFVELSQYPSGRSSPSTFRQMLGNLKGRSFIQTQDGYFGLGPPKTQKDDIIYTILGCRDLVVLRPLMANTYRLVGSCYIHGLSDAEQLLGRLLDPWSFQVKPGGTGRRVHYFRNQATGEESEIDPRLGSLPPDWEPCEAADNNKEAERVAWFKDMKTGKILNSDPRMLPGALEGRGVNVRKIHLV